MRLFSLLFASLLSTHLLAQALSPEESSGVNSEASGDNFSPSPMSESEAIKHLESIHAEHGFLSSQERFDEFLVYFTQMEKDFINNYHVYASMNNCQNTIGTVSYSPSIGQRFESIVTTYPKGDACLYMSKTNNEPQLTVCEFTHEEVAQVSLEAKNLFRRAYEDINKGVHTQIMGGQPFFGELLSSPRCKLIDNTKA